MNHVKVAIWTIHPGDLLGQAIDFVTRGTAQHAGFIRGNGMIHELYLPKVRDRAMLDSEKQYVKIFDIEGMNDDLSGQLEKLFDLSLTTSGEISYSIVGLFRILFDRPNPSDKSMVCSQYVFHSLELIGLPPLARCTADFISPRDLYISPRLLDTP
ncbi:MAG: hypothetical protein KGL39_30280 [Patescibacteria group bacterium]|nr:hypothetical protein [Patescibacteria group bacterium]